MSTIVFEGDLTAVNVQGVKNKIQDGMADKAGIRIQFSNTNDCDSLGIQLLISAQITAAARNIPLVLAGDLVPVLDTIQRVGLSPEEYFTIEDRRS